MSSKKHEIEINLSNYVQVLFIKNYKILLRKPKETKRHKNLKMIYNLKVETCFIQREFLGVQAWEAAAQGTLKELLWGVSWGARLYNRSFVTSVNARSCAQSTVRPNK